jgi:hypothetical protein
VSVCKSDCMALPSLLLFIPAESADTCHSAVWPLPPPFSSFRPPDPTLPCYTVWLVAFVTTGTRPNATVDRVACSFKHRPGKLIRTWAFVPSSAPPKKMSVEYAKEASVQDYHSTLRNTPEGRRSCQQRGGRLKSWQVIWAARHTLPQWKQFKWSKSKSSSNASTQHAWRNNSGTCTQF